MVFHTPLQFRRRAIPFCAVFTAVFFVPAGCQWGDPQRAVQRIPAIETLDYDGLDLRVGVDPAAGVELYVQGLTVEAADLRVTDEFHLTDGRGFNETYRVLLLSEDRIVLKRTRYIDHRGERRGIQRQEQVLSLKPYRPARADP